MERLKTKRNFTIIELLVTIAIIAILAQLLIPVLANAKKKAREVKCLSAVKQTNSAINLYTEDFTFYPYGKQGLIDFTYSIRAYLWPYASTISPLLECPVAKHSETDAIWVSYAVHPVIMPDFTQGQTRMWKAGELKRIAEMIIITEACQLNNAGCYPTLKSIPGIFTTGVEASKDNSVIGEFDKHNEDGDDNNEGWPRFRHIYNRANTGYADGHASNVKINQISEGNIKTNY
jgi:prepilin-type N-terminal cleavage/methylation domain-containing protein/prepilin-type processing-associated H-X9-DG protein